MKTRLLCLLLLCTLGSPYLRAQNDILIDYKTYAAHDSTSRQDVKQLKKTDKIYFEEGDTYQNALAGYLSLYKKTPDYKALNWRIAMCYLRSEQKEKALSYLLSCDSTMSPLYLFYLAKAYHVNNDYEQAKLYYEDFQDGFPQSFHRLFYSTFEIKKRQYPFDTIMNRLISACDVGLTANKDTLNYRFEAISILNKASNELSPMLLSDKKIYFASDRLHDKYSTMQVYEIKYDSAEFIGAPKISTRLPYKANDSRIPLCEDTTYNTLIYQSMENGGDFLMATQKKNKVKVKPIKALNTSAREGSACLLNDSTIVFSSTRGKKQNESELYISERNEKGRWQAPQKVAGNINSIGREEAVSYSNGELYFISNGPASMGGFDIFKVPYLGNNQWGAVENLGASINTADNDMAYFSLDSATAIYCGVRPGGEGGTDLYKVTTWTAQATNDTTPSDNIDTLFIIQMKQELLMLDSLYSDPGLIGDFDQYNSQLDSLLDNDELYNIMQNIEDSVDSLIIPTVNNDSLFSKITMGTDSLLMPSKLSDTLINIRTEVIDSTLLMVE